MEILACSRDSYVRPAQTLHFPTSLHNPTQMFIRTPQWQMHTSILPTNSRAQIPSALETQSSYQPCEIAWNGLIHVKVGDLGKVANGWKIPRWLENLQMIWKFSDGWKIFRWLENFQPNPNRSLRDQNPHFWTDKTRPHRQDRRTDHISHEGYPSWITRAIRTKTSPKSYILDWQNRNFWTSMSPTFDGHTDRPFTSWGTSFLCPTHHSDQNKSKIMHFGLAISCRNWPKPYIFGPIIVRNMGEKPCVPCAISRLPQGIWRQKTHHWNRLEETNPEKMAQQLAVLPFFWQG